MAHHQDSGSKVWAKGDPCLSPFSGDEKLYKAVIQRIHRSPVGHLTATVKYHGYSDEEEVDVARLQEVKVKERESTVKKMRPATSPGMFKPLTGGEADKRMEEKYGGLDKQTEIKSEKLSASLFSYKRKSPLIASQMEKNSQGKERRIGVVAIGGEAISRSRSPAAGKKVKDNVLKIDSESDSEGEEAANHVNSARKRKKKDVVATGGEALDRSQELPTSRKISDISSILDPDSVHDALNGRYNASAKIKTTGALEQMDDSTAANGFDEDDLEKPKFSFKPEGAKVPYALSEKGQEPQIQVPATINQYLRDYQREGIKFLYSHYTYEQGAILGDDMGLGKTVQVIGFLAALLGKQGNRVDVMRQKPKFIRKLSDSSAIRHDTKITSPFLIIGPGCVLYNWLEELETWGYFTVRKFHGASKNDCLSDIKKEKVEIVVTTFETFREHQGILNKIEWEAVIADEVHKIKGLKAQTTQALRGINTRRRYGLTGTALQNNLLELWCILDWAQPGCLGRLPDFQEEYVRPIELGQRHDANKRELAQARKSKERFAEMRKGMMIRRMKSLIAEQLPKKDDNVVFCRLSQLQTSIYKTILDHPNMDLVLHMEDPCGCDSGIPQSKCCKKKTPDGHSVKALMFTFMHLLLKVSNHVAMLVPKNNTSEQQNKMARTICAVAFEKHPGFVNQTREASFQTLSDPKYCGKMKILQGLLKVFYKDHSQVLVFSYSTQALDIIEQYLMSTGYEFRRIDGSVSAKKRQIIVREFNSDPNIFVCLISTKAGGLGLNLTGANRVIIFDPNWNPTHDLQAQDRIGQRRNVQVYRLVSAGTIEENMYLRQIYKQQLLNVSVEDENARRYFYAVQGNKHQKGELFGVKNMFQLHTGKSCLTVDIIKRNERVESALAGFEMTKYVPPVVRVEDDEDYEDIEDLQKETSESEVDVFAQFFSSQEANDDANDSAAHDEVDAVANSDDDDDDDMLHSSDDNNSDSSVDLLINENKKRKIYKHQINVKRSAKKTNQISEESDDSDMLDDFGYLNDSDHISHKQSDSNRKRKLNVTFKTPEPCNSAKKGKVRPSQSTTGKGPAKQGKGQASDRGRGKGPVRKGRRDSMEEEDGSFRVDQTLAGSFTDVGDVFENCGVVHIHENVKVVGGSRAEDHMSKCAMNDVYELHQNSQDLAVQCDPLSESSEEEAPLSTSKKRESAMDHNTSRSVVIDTMKVLIGQTPRGIRMKQFEKLNKENKSGTLTDFAELVLSLTKEERIDMLNKHYGGREPKLKDILTGTQQNEREESEKPKRSQGGQRKQKQPTEARKKVKKRARKLEQSLAGFVYEDVTDSESLPQPTSTVDDEISLDVGSDMDIGVSPVKRRKTHILNQSRSKPRKTPRKKQSDHVQIPPSYMEYPVSDEDTSDDDEKVSSPRKRNKNRLDDKPLLKTRISENQLDCIESPAYDDSADSSDLYSEMAKMSQVDVKATVEQVNKHSGASHRNYGDKDRNSNCNKDEISRNDTTNDYDRTGRAKCARDQEDNKNRSPEVHRHTENRGRNMTGSEHGDSCQNSRSKFQDRNQNSSLNTRTKLKNPKLVDEGANSQVSILDDLFENVGTKVKSKRKPAPSRGKATKDLNKNYKTKLQTTDTRASDKDGGHFKAVDEIFCSTDSDSEIHLETSTLKDDDHDCFDDPRKWKKRKQKTQKVERAEMSAVDKLISDSEADFNNLFAAGKMKRKDRTSNKKKESSPVKNCDRSASLFSF